MSDTEAHLLIQGNFKPARIQRLMRALTRILSVVSVLALVGALVVYGFKVHVEGSINRLAAETRDLNESNKDLQVRLNHLRSFKNVEAAAIQVPHLHVAETVIEVPAAAPYKFVSVPRLREEFPRVYGY